MRRMHGHSVQLVADNTDVFSGTIASQTPPWARFVRLAITSTDSDTLYSATISGEEVARNSAPHYINADNVSEYNWSNPHVKIPAKRDLDNVVDVNIVTGAVVIVHIIFEG